MNRMYRGRHATESPLGCDHAHIVCQSRKVLTGNIIRKAVQEKVCSSTKLLSGEDPFLGESVTTA